MTYLDWYIQRFGGLFGHTHEKQTADFGSKISMASSCSDHLLFAKPRTNFFHRSAFSQWNKNLPKNETKIETKIFQKLYASEDDIDHDRQKIKNLWQRQKKHSARICRCLLIFLSRWLSAQKWAYWKCSAAHPQQSACLLSRMIFIYFVQYHNKVQTHWFSKAAFGKFTIGIFHICLLHVNNDICNQVRTWWTIHSTQSSIWRIIWVGFDPLDFHNCCILSHSFHHLWFDTHHL